MDRNLGMDLVRVTEASALGSSRLMGRGDDVAVDKAAIEAMRQTFDNELWKDLIIAGQRSCHRVKLVVRIKHYADGEKQRELKKYDKST